MIIDVFIFALYSLRVTVDFTLSNARQFYLSKGDPSLSKLTDPITKINQSDNAPLPVKYSPSIGPGNVLNDPVR